MKDKCITCGKETPYDKDLHINNRLWYVECAGQLCRACWEDVYKVQETGVEEEW
jgi:hypothetical protein